MHKAKKINASQWSYRRGVIEHWPTGFGRRNNWSWQVCGASGWVNNKLQAKQQIDSLRAQAGAILESERQGN